MSAKAVIVDARSTQNLTRHISCFILPIDVAEQLRIGIVAQGDEGMNSIQKLTDFAVCDSVLEAEAVAEESDLPAEAFDRRMVRDCSQSDKERILIFACPGCVEEASKVIHGRCPAWILFLAKLRFFLRKTRKR